MEEEELRREFEAFLRAERLPRYEEAVRVRQMSDSEFETYIDDMLVRVNINLQRDGSQPVSREAYAQSVRARKIPEPEVFAESVRRDAELLTPYLMQVREDLGITGPITSEQAQATYASTQVADQDERIASLREELRRELDPTLASRLRVVIEDEESVREFLHRLSRTVDADERTLIYEQFESGGGVRREHFAEYFKHKVRNKKKLAQETGG